MLPATHSAGKAVPCYLESPGSSPGLILNLGPPSTHRYFPAPVLHGLEESWLDSDFRRLVFFLVTSHVHTLKGDYRGWASVNQQRSLTELWYVTGGERWLVGISSDGKGNFYLLVLPEFSPQLELFFCVSLQDILCL